MLIKFERDLTSTQISNLTTSEVRSVNYKNCGICKDEAICGTSTCLECKDKLVLKAMEYEKDLVTVN